MGTTGRHGLSALMGALPLLLVGVAAAAAQVTVGPTSLYLTDRQPFGTFLVSNQSDEAQEVVLGFRFGFPVSDTLGEMRMEWEDQAAASRYGIDPWVQAFPRQFVLEPGAQQTVRLAVRPPRDLEDGVYWTRLITTSNPLATVPDESEEGVQARVVFRLQQVTTVLLLAGPVDTGLTLGDPTVTADASTVVVRVPMERTGASPYFGTATVTLRDVAGDVVAETSASVAVYFDLVRRFELDRSGVPPGQYTVDVRFVSTRSDIPPQHWIRSDPVTRSVVLPLP